jgi:hypothetical protein
VLLDNPPPEPVIVMVYVPVGVEVEVFVVIVLIAVCEFGLIVTEIGSKETEMPDGRFEAEKLMIF